MSKKKDKDREKDKKKSSKSGRRVELVRPPGKVDLSLPEAPAGQEAPQPAAFDLVSQMADCSSTIGTAMDVVVGDFSEAPERLVAAMRHGTSGGKRLRPFLVRLTGEMFGESPLRTRALQLAIEMIHCYSLIHDDLPAMDDDDLRRGRPTVHKAFDDATAILAGDALLTLAFQWAATRIGGSADRRARIVGELAEASGLTGMVAGQTRDLEAETNDGTSLDDIALTMNMKTGRLIRAAVRVGAIYGGADDAALEAVTRYGEIAGAVFQLADDLLDATSDTATLGKKAGKDNGRGKQTLVSRLGVKDARKRMDELVQDAIASLGRFGPEADPLRETVKYFAARTN
jgi:farnesyl diphosphate synthase